MWCRRGCGRACRACPGQPAICVPSQCPDPDGPFPLPPPMLLPSTTFSIVHPRGPSVSSKKFDTKSHKDTRGAPASSSDELSARIGGVDVPANLVGSTNTGTPTPTLPIGHIRSSVSVLRFLLVDASAYASLTCSSDGVDVCAKFATRRVPKTPTPPPPAMLLTTAVRGITRRLVSWLLVSSSDAIPSSLLRWGEAQAWAGRQFLNHAPTGG